MAKSKPTSTTVTTLATLSQAETEAPVIMDFLEKELKGLKTIAETAYRVGSPVEGVNIKTETNIANLIKLASAVTFKEKAYNEAAEGVLAESLGGNFPTFSLNGSTKADVLHDINLKIKVISSEERRKELEDLINEGKAFITKEHQYAMYQKKLVEKFQKYGKTATEGAE